MMSKKIFSIIVLVLLISLFVGVSSVFAASGSDEKITISFTWWGDTKRNEIYNKIVDLFEAANPNIKVDRPFGTWANYWDKLSILVAGGDAPDVVGMHQDFVSDYALRGALLNLKPYIDSGTIDISAIPESVYEGGFVKGIPYMIAQGVNITGYIFNTATFDDLGVSYPDMNWTWKDHTEKAIELTKAGKAKGKEMWWGAYDDSNKFIPAFTYWAKSKGQTLYTSDGELGFTEDTLVSWYNYWKDLRDKGAVPDAATTIEYYRNMPLEQNLFNNGKVGIVQLPANQVVMYQDQVTNDGEIHLVRIPHFEDGLPGEYVAGSFLAVTSDSKNPEAAAKLISFFINNTEAQRLFMLEQGVPPTKTAIEAISDKLTATQKRIINFVEETLEIAGSAAYPPAGNTEINSLFEENGNAVAFGQLTPEEGAAKFMQDANDVLSRN